MAQLPTGDPTSDTIRFQCGACMQRLSSPVRRAGSVVRCPKCKRETRVAFLDEQHVVAINDLMRSRENPYRNSELLHRLGYRVLAHCLKEWPEMIESRHLILQHFGLEAAAACPPAVVAFFGSELDHHAFSGAVELSELCADALAALATEDARAHLRKAYRSARYEKLKSILASRLRALRDPLIRDEYWDVIQNRNLPPWKDHEVSSATAYLALSGDERVAASVAKWLKHWDFTVNDQILDYVANCGDGAAVAPLILLASKTHHPENILRVLRILLDKRTDRLDAAALQAIVEMPNMQSLQTVATQSDMTETWTIDRILPLETADLRERARAELARRIVNG